MKYIRKPKLVEAIPASDLKTVLEWLQPGEYTLAGNDQIVVVHNKVSYRAYLGTDYLVRDEKGVYPVSFDDFEKEHVSADEVPHTSTPFDFEAFQSDDGSFQVWCPSCGPISTVETEADFAHVGLTHILEAHQEEV